MANYLKDNFIVPIGSDIVLKIINSTNMVTHIVREPLCTVKAKDNLVYIKQQSESDTITLDFSTNIEAQQAAILLRNVLITLKANIQANIINPNTYNSYTIPTITNGQTVFNLPFTPNTILIIFVNGDALAHTEYILVNNMLTLNIIGWLLPIESTDNITLIYN